MTENIVLEILSAFISIAVVCLGYLFIPVIGLVRFVLDILDRFDLYKI